LGYADFTASLGGGAGQVDLSGGGGFSAYGGNRAVNIGGDKHTLKWADPFFVGDNKALMLGGPQSNATIDFQNGIDLAGKTRTVYSYNGSGNIIDAKISGSISNSTGVGSLVKQGAGVLELSNNNTYTGQTKIANGSILQTHAGALGTGNLLISGEQNNYDAQLGLGSGNFIKSLGVGAGQVQMTGTGAGFFAYGANRSVNIGNDRQTLVWGSTYFNPGKLVLSHATSDATTDFQNGIDLGGASRTIQVDNGSKTVDVILSGVISNGTLVKTGAGTLDLVANTSNLTGVSVKGGEFLLSASIGSANKDVSGGVFGLMNGDLITTIGTGSDQLQFTAGGGFAAYGGDRKVAFVDSNSLPVTLKWGNTGFIPFNEVRDGQGNVTATDTNSLANSLILGSDYSTGAIELQNNIDLSQKQRSFEIRNGTAATDVTLSGNITNGVDGIVKTGGGTLQLTGTNSYTGTTGIQSGRLIVSNTGSLASSVSLQKNTAFIYNGTSSYLGNVTMDGAEFYYNSAALFKGSVSGSTSGWTGILGGNANFSEMYLFVGKNQTLSPGFEGTGTLIANSVSFQYVGTYLWKI
ncbi:MAG: autotransporter-associated beta strand repeat-containing protein, partial [Verrucomicrobiota bacterium]